MMVESEEATRDCPKMVGVFAYGYKYTYIHTLHAKKKKRKRTERDSGGEIVLRILTLLL